MTIRWSEATRNAMVNTWVDAIDAGAAAGTIKVYTGAQPATADTAASGTLLVTLTCADPAFGAAASGSADIDADPDLSAVAGNTGTAGWARVADSDGNTVFDGSVTASGGGGDFIINSTAIESGQTVTLTTGSVSLPS